MDVRELVDYFAKDSREACQAAKTGLGKPPHYPMLVVFLGDEAVQGFPSIYASLSRLWTRYMQEIKFLKIDKGSNGQPVYTQLSKGGTVVSLKSENDVMDVLNALFDRNTHFTDYSTLLVYYVLNTSSFERAKDFDQWKGLMDDVRSKALCTNPTICLNVVDMLIILLNEDFRRHHSEVANEIKDRFVSGTEYSVFLLNNRLRDGRIDSSWENSYRIAAILMALSNYQVGDIAAPLFRNNVKAVGYAREEKRFQEIGSTVVDAMVTGLERSRKGSDWKALQAGEDLVSRLGVEEDGTFRILNRYIDEKELMNRLPTEDELELFPRAGQDKYVSLSQLSAQEFDEATMGAWSCMLARLSEEAVRSVLKENWIGKYGRELRKEFTVSELASLGKHPGELWEKILPPCREPFMGEYDLEYGRKRLEYDLSSDSGLREALRKELAAQGEEAARMVEAWDNFYQTRGELFPVEDDSIRSYYQGAVDSYFAKDGAERIKEFQTLRKPDEKSSEETLWKLLTEILKDITEADDIFQASFEDEINTRIEAVNAGRGNQATVNAVAQIVNNLTTNVPIYCMSVTGLGDPIFSAVLMRSGGTLLKQLPVGIYKYDTGDGSMAEALYIYELEKIHLQAARRDTGDGSPEPEQE